MNARLLLIAGCLFTASMLLTNVATITGEPEVKASGVQPTNPWERIERQLDELHREVRELHRRIDQVQ
ncbi:MAG: hypothetical protein JNM18_15835 [Planctomycetaceae bacterium]|nr:hypothetical protein [Planctomycetaceae bacterium]